MEEIWIIGVGHFGLLAADRLGQTLKQRSLVLVDTAEKNLSRAKGPNRTLVQADGVQYLATHLRSGEKRPTWIIPALPVHLAAEWCLRCQGPKRLRRVPLPLEMDALLPNPARGNTGDLYVSHADFLCPDDCPEPHDLCTVTRKPRKRNMFEILEHLRLPPYKSLVLRSHQLGAGIGGYRPEQLFGLMNQVEKTRGPLMLSTACRCHGVVTGLERL